MRTATGLFVTLGILALAVTPAAAGTVTITFSENGLVHGDELTTDISGLTVSAYNADGNGPDEAVIFDSTKTSTADPDLEDPWKGGNISDVALGNMVIIQENATGGPDDEGSRPAGTLTFDFGTTLLNAIGFDFVDIERGETSYLSVFDSSGTQVGSTIAFSSMTSSEGTIEFEDNYANRVDQMTFASGAYFSKAVFSLGGSGALDNLKVTVVPLPSAAWMGLALIGLVGARTISRRRRRTM